MEKGRLGDKTRQGFYKKDGKQHPLARSRDRRVSRAQRAGDPVARRGGEDPEPARSGCSSCSQQDDKPARLARHIVYNALGYAARRVPEISDDLASIDRAVRWGFSHDLGPFELWDALGVKETADAMEANGVAVAPWVREMLAAGHETFYRERRVVVRPGHEVVRRRSPHDPQADRRWQSSPARGQREQGREPASTSATACSVSSSTRR